MSTEYIYLIQDISTNKCRITDKQPTAKILFQMICIKSAYAKNTIISKFDKKFTSDDGEYFTGDCNHMIDIIYQIIKEDYLAIEYIDVKSIELIYSEISKVFPNYKLDESFGGSKKYISIDYGDDDTYIIYYLNTFNSCDLQNHHIDMCDSIFCEHIIRSYDIYTTADKSEYFHSLIKQKIINVDDVYDINSEIFINLLTSAKINIDVIGSVDLKTDLKTDQTSEKIKNLLTSGIIINNALYTVVKKDTDDISIVDKFKTMTDFDTFYIDISWPLVQIYYINAKYYYKSHLRKYTPYLIRYNDEFNYYLLNREYEYIGLDAKPSYKDEIYILDSPWIYTNSAKHLKDLISNYKKIINSHGLKQCLNMNVFTDEILAMV